MDAPNEFARHVMTWINELLDKLVTTVPCGYHRDGPPATEPTALAAIALCAHGNHDAAVGALGWLSGLQSGDGSIGPTEELNSPGWPTSLVLLAHRLIREHGSTAIVSDRSRIGGNEKLQSAQVAFDADRAIAWLLEAKGEVRERTAPMGHDPMLLGWPWVLGTHSWLEPTALAVLALKATGHGSHRRTREAIRLIYDRQLADGGWNYGNTVVLGQTLRPHLQPTALALLALNGEQDNETFVAKSVAYLQAELAPNTATASLCYGILALGRYGVLPANAENWLEAAYHRSVARDGSPHKLTLLALAASCAAGFAREASEKRVDTDEHWRSPMTLTQL